MNTAPRVSILVFVELALDGWIRRDFLPELQGVSILVFVELALDDRGNSSFRGEEPWFQSLFSWNLLLMISWPPWLPPEHPVSILVFVELALDAGRQRTPMRPPGCFNPCFRGTCS